MFKDATEAHSAGCLGDAFDRARKKVETDPSAAAKSKITLPPIVSAREFATKPMTVPKELVHGLLHQGSKMVLAASSKSFKTFSLIDLGLSVASGTEWWGFTTTQGRVLYINLELDPFFCRQRLLWILKQKGLEEEVLDAVDILNLRGHCTDFTQLQELIAEVAEKKYAMIILDPIYKVMGSRDENSAGAIGDLLNQFEQLAVKTGAAVVYAHHFSKGNQAKKDSIDRPSGSGVFARDADCLLVMTKHEEQYTYTVDATLRNHKPIDSFCVEWKEPLMVRNDDLNPSKLKQANGQGPKYVMADLLKVLGVQELTRAEFLKQFTTAKGASERTFDKLFKEAKDKDIIPSDDTKKWKAVTPHYPPGHKFTNE